MNLKGMNLWTLRRHLLVALGGRQIDNLSVRAEFVEIEPVEGYRKYEATGKIFITLEASPGNKA